MTRLHVRHYVQRYPPALGGSEVYYQRLCQDLTRRGHDTTVYTTTAVDLEAFWRTGKNELPAGMTIEDGVRVTRYTPWRFPGRRYVLKAMSLVTHRQVQALTTPCNPISPAMWRDAGRPDRTVDAVHTAAFPYSYPIACAYRCARTNNVPFLVTPFVHQGDPADPNDRTRRAYTAPHLAQFLRSADRVFVQTPGERDVVLSLGVPEGRVVLQGLGVDVGDCTGGDGCRFRARWGLSNDAIVIGHLANLSVEKGAVDLLRAVRQLTERCRRPFRLVLAGPAMPNFVAELERISPYIGLIRTGPLSDEQKRDFFAGIDVFALPTMSDSFGLVLLEAWANGVPCLTYRSGGVCDIVRHEVDGLLTPCRDVPRLADDEARCRWGEAGRQRLAKEFCWADKLDLFHEVLQEVVCERSALGPSEPRP